MISMIIIRKTLHSRFIISSCKFIFKAIKAEYLAGSKETQPEQTEEFIAFDTSVGVIAMEITL